jgi:hypothetical protein
MAAMTGRLDGVDRRVIGFFRVSVDTNDENRDIVAAPGRETGYQPKGLYRPQADASG